MCFLLLFVGVVVFRSERLSSLEEPTRDEKKVVRGTIRNKVHHNKKGAIVFLAPQRTEGSIWGIDRFCMLLRAVRSVDRYLNTKYGPYPIYILVARDYALDPKHKDGPYTEKDRALLQHWAPHSTIHFEEINVYSQDALEPNTTPEQILQWRKGNDGSVPGRDLGYTSMCRLWSGRLQSMSFLQDYTYYLRMDDDSLLTADFLFDPFLQMDQKNLTYAFRRTASDDWGIDQLWQVSRPHVINVGTTSTSDIPFLDGGEYNGGQPYNNFHVSRVDFWTSTKWRTLWKEFNENHLFYKYRVGDANVHAIAMMMMETSSYATWPTIPYVHNSNDYGPSWGTKAWGEECARAY
jgi:hypothetical protein